MGSLACESDEWCFGQTCPTLTPRAPALSSPPTVPMEYPTLQHLVHLRHVAHHRLLKSPTNISARTTFCDLRRQCTKLSRALKNAYFTEQCRVYSRNPRPLWNTINLLTGRLHAHAPPQASMDDLSEDFFSLLWLLMLIGRLNLWSRGSQHQPPITCLTVFNLSQNQRCSALLQNIDVRKSAGSDGLPGCILKKCAKDLAPSLTNLINTVLTHVRWATHSLEAGDSLPCFQEGSQVSCYSISPYFSSSAGQQTVATGKSCWSSTTKLLGGVHCNP